jgi:hypothetical protein
MRQQGIRDAAFEDGAEQERAKWQAALADKDARLADKDAEIVRRDRAARRAAVTTRPWPRRCGWTSPM